MTTRYFGAGEYTPEHYPGVVQPKVAVKVTLANDDVHEYLRNEGRPDEWSRSHEYAIDPSGALHIVYRHSSYPKSRSDGEPTRTRRSIVRTYNAAAWTMVEGQVIDDPHHIYTDQYPDGQVFDANK